ncbi:hypothetical protein IQ219_15250 [Synechocystis sp. LEGE 06083]|uniref:hypothetical protein n=1 Tax=Synechocystis sp. LEGE 06083 TaxID=915336 RepID=UPI0018813948|nr:hypothetical protein [Synechocystis sp. LEGE 06083]MBE9196631.1 hypothetical protein [Synechocystis sp. LEGE 06083]
MKEKPENLVFFDEMRILLGIMRDMARILMGTRAYDFDSVYKGTRLNYAGAMSLSGTLCLKLLPKSIQILIRLNIFGGNSKLSFVDLGPEIKNLLKS